MVTKQVGFNEDAREGLRKGINILADAVKCTLGAMGRNVVIHKEGRAPHVTKDGFSVAKEIFLDDTLENMGAQLIKGVSAKTVEDTADGTTTATVIAQSIINGGMDILKEDKDVNPIDLKRGIDKAVVKVVAYLEESSKPVGTPLEIKQVATVSANNDSEIGNIVAKAIEEVTKDGTITVEESQSFDTYVDIVEGFKLHRGLLTAGFITNPLKQVAVLEKPYIFITPDSIENIQEILPVLQKVPVGRSILIISGNISGEAIATLAINKVREGFRVAAIKAPFLGSRMKDTLTDLATLTGGVSVSADTALTFDKFEASMFGSCDKVIIDRDSTIMVGVKGDKDNVGRLKSSLKFQAKKAKSKFERDEFKERLALVCGGVAVIYVGANSEIEMREKKDRVEDALGATKSAIEEGVVAGGGLALLRASVALIPFNAENNDQVSGICLVAEAIQAPLSQIVENAGLDSKEIIKELFSGPSELGYDVRIGKKVKMVKSGIIDPTKVVRVALENAASVASVVLMTDCTIVPTLGI